MARTTIADVAKVAGVSKATVSRVLSGHYDYMRDDTRTKVEEAIAKLDYRPNSIARSLTSNRTNTAAILISDVGNPFYADVIHGVEDVAFDGNYDVFLCNTKYDTERGLTFVRSLIDKRVDGIMVMSSSMSDVWLQEMRQNNVPVVIVDWEVNAPGSVVSTIGVDFMSGIQRAADHLVALGHRSFVHVSGPLELRTSRNRRDAFLSGLARHGIPERAVHVIEGNLQIDGGKKAVEQIMELQQAPSAVFAANDLMAIGVVAGARANGLSVPEDLSVVGLDDIWLAEQVDPPLTTVSLPRYEIGQLAMQMLFDLMDPSADPSPTPDHRQVASSLIIRESTTSAPK